MKEREEFKAPKGKFRVVGVDTFSHEYWVYGDYNALQEATDFAKLKGSNMNMVYVYDDKGEYKFHAGTF